MKVYSPSAIPGAAVVVRHQGLLWEGSRDQDGAIPTDDRLDVMLQAAGWNYGRVRVEADVCGIGAEEPFSTAVRYRHISQPQCNLQYIHQLSEFVGLFKGQADHVVEWSDRNQAAVLDLDNHQRQIGLQIERAVHLIPTPYAVKRSRNGGLHALYVGSGVISAYDLACLAAFQSYTLFPEADSAEVLTRARCSPGGWRFCPRRFYKPFGANLYQVDDDEVAEWLAEQGLHPGGRYGHSLCPFDPTPGDDPNPSVVVTDAGIYCFRCERKASWNFLLHQATDEAMPPIWQMAQHRVWWDQVEGWGRYHRARLLQYLKPAYRGALTLLHGCLPSVYASLYPHNLLRTDLGWVVVDDQLKTQDLAPRHATRAIHRLPSIYRLPRAAEDVKQTNLMLGDLETQYLTDGVNLPGVPPMCRGTRAFTAVSRQPSGSWEWYLKPARWSLWVAPPSEREVEQAWNLVRGLFPRLDEGYLSLLIVAHLIAQVETPPQPLLIAVTGVSGAGKTNTTRLAAALVDGAAAIITANSSQDFSLQLGSALMQHPEIICLDEYLKRNTEAAAQSIYELGQYYTFTIKYRNPICLPIHCPIVMTGIALAPIFRQSAQFARRCALIELQSHCRWIKARSMNLLETWNDDPARRAAADVICSDLAYKYVINSDNLVESWSQAVETFGRTLADLTAGLPDDNVDELVRSFFYALQEYGRVHHAGRHKTPRYVLSLLDNNEATRLWLELCNGSRGDELYTSDRLQERELAETLGIDMPLRVYSSRVRANAVSFAVRSNGEPRLLEEVLPKREEESDEDDSL